MYTNRGSTSTFKGICYWQITNHGHVWYMSYFCPKICTFLETFFSSSSKSCCSVINFWSWQAPPCHWLQHFSIQYKEWSKVNTWLCAMITHQDYYIQTYIKAFNNLMVATMPWIFVSSQLTIHSISTGCLKSVAKKKHNQHEVQCCCSWCWLGRRLNQFEI